MTPFLDKTAEYIIQNFHKDIDSICVVLPNRRAGLFLKRSISRQVDKPLWSPVIFSLPDFILELSGYKLLDPVLLQFELYKTYQEITGEKAQTFEEFIKWGRVLLHDFNEADMYLADTDQLFGYLTSEKALSLWNPENQPLTPFQINYLEFYRSMKTFYDRFSASLKNRGEVYQGMAYRKVARSFEHSEINLPWKHVVFAGFNALVPAEKLIIRTLEKNGFATVLWDADNYYLNDQSQESGLFIRDEYKHTTASNFKWVSNALSESEKVIDFVGVPRNIAQVKAAGILLKDLAAQPDELDNTVVVLNDESVLEPLLNSMPEEVGQFNITMGFALRNTPLFRLLDYVLELQINILKFKKPGPDFPKLYFRDVIRILEHPYIRKLMKGTSAENLASDIRKSNKIFLDFKDFQSAFSSAHTASSSTLGEIFQPWNDDPLLAVDAIIDLLNGLKDNILTQPEATDDSSMASKLELEYLYHFNAAVQKLSLLIKEYPFIRNLKVLKSLFMQLVEINLPFYGEPLQGLQVMGMLETQTLDFRNIIMLGANEDFIPAGKSMNSFIPFDIRRKFSLPTFLDKNAVYAYHFYRLIQRAEKITIFFNSEPGDLGGGDKSRFISQLQYELPGINPNVVMNEKIMTVPLTDEKKMDEGITIAKPQELIAILKQHAEKGLSASALNTYLNCPLQFYFNYVAGINEADEPEETIEANTLGSVVHEVLSVMYKELEDKNLTLQDISVMKSRVKVLVGEAFQKIYSGGEIGYGKNLLIANVATLYVSNFLNAELALLNRIEPDNGKLTIREVEKPYFTSHSIDLKGQKILVNLYGRFDRVDELNGKIRIIDYKTGKTELKELRLTDWEDILTEGNLAKTFQLLFYTFIYSRSKAMDSSGIQPGIISFRNLNSGFMGLTLPDDDPISAGAMKRFESVLETIFAEIFDEERPFVQTSKPENCIYCAYKSVCNRV